MLKTSTSLKTLKNGRRIRILFFFLFISFLFWILIKLSKPYTDVVNFNLAYTNVPEGKMLQGEVPDKISVYLRDYGFNLVKYNLSRKQLTIDLKSLKKKSKNTYYLRTNHIKDLVSKQTSSEIDVADIKPDTLFFNMVVSRSKQVPISPDLTLEYQLGYQLLGNLVLNPKTVTISGPENIIDTIYEVLTEPKELKNLNSDIDLNIPIKQIPAGQHVSYSKNSVHITGDVEKFTEERFEVPLEVKNIPDNHILQAFPDKVTVIFNIGLSDYYKVKKEDFRVVCNYNLTIENGLNYLIPEVVDKPAYITEVRVIPDKIDFFIKK